MTKQMKKLNKKQSGFTLVEIAIVVAIIGVLLGGVIKGQEILESAKQQRVYSDFKSLQAAVFVYIDRKGQIPGDEDETGGLTAAEVGADSTSTTAGVWFDMRDAGIVEGIKNNKAPTGPYGGDIQVTVGLNKICIPNVPKAAAEALNTKRGGTIHESIASAVPSTALANPVPSDKNGPFFMCFEY